MVAFDIATEAELVLLSLKSQSKATRAHHLVATPDSTSATGYNWDDSRKA